MAGVVGVCMSHRKVRGSHIPDLPKGNVNAFEWLPVTLHLQLLLWRIVRFAWAGNRSEELFVCVVYLSDQWRKKELSGPD